MYYLVGLVAVAMLLIMELGWETKKLEKDTSSPVAKEEVKKEAPVEMKNVGAGHSLSHFLWFNFSRLKVSAQS